MGTDRKTTRIASPIATGGGGTLFEQHVNAYWLAQLLVAAIPPILVDCSVTEVHFQTEHLGWHTDDFLVVGQNGSGAQRKLVGQVKRAFTVSAADPDCKKAIQDFWKDFKEAARFSQTSDRLILVTQRGTNTLLESFGGLLDCARAANSGAEFQDRLDTPGFVNAKAVQYHQEVLAIVGELEGAPPSQADLWSFLRVMYVLSLDLGTATRQTESAIKSILAYTTTGANGIAVAEATWNSLVVLASQGMPEARTFRQADLPEQLRLSHTSTSSNEHQALAALKSHSRTILRAIRSTVGNGFHLGRAKLVQQVLEKLDQTPVVLISGPAGAGKSAIAKAVVDHFSIDHLVHTFRAEEFAQPHFDATLQAAHVHVGAEALSAILAGQPRRLLFVDSVERLLEHTTRDAFKDLLDLASRDNGQTVILTCRDYSTELVRSNLLEFSQVGHTIVTVPPLSDEELAEVQVSNPSLERLFKSQQLRQMLRNPYVLDRAMRIPWSEDRTLPQTERDFRTLFWKEAVRADQYRVNGMPDRRQRGFIEIALRRARALSLYVPREGIDDAVIEQLEKDSLITVSDQSSALLAPAHDILEDWAILHWLEEQYVSNRNIQTFHQLVGAYPAVRRTYRKWVAELIDRDVEEADRFFRDSGGADVPAYFRDDTLISLLRAPSAPEFLKRHQADILSNNNGLLHRSIHLLRVACVRTPDWLQGQGPLFNIPDGPAWPAVLEMFAQNLQSFGKDDYALLLGLIEDWAKGVSGWEPHPSGIESAAAIALWLIAKLKGYESRDSLKRTVQVLAKIPAGDRERFEALLKGTGRGDRRDQVAAELRELVLTGIAGVPAARDLPSVVVSVALSEVLCSEEDIRDERGYWRVSIELDSLFGIKEGELRYFPASAFRGPVLSLLQHHAQTGLSFLFRVFAHSADWYAHPRVTRQIEPPFEMELRLPDGTVRKQWCNERLWNLYRGTSVGPHVLQSYLMALERWLLEIGKVHPGQLDDLLMTIIRQSDSVALTAITASVATAYPLLCADTLITLLRCPLCITLDRQRMVAESQKPSQLFKAMPSHLVANQIYEQEREHADSLPHRASSLENAILNLQLGPRASEVQDVLDELRSELPSLTEQTEKHRVWRLALHRMDLRRYTISKDESGKAIVGSTRSDGRDKSYVRLDSERPEPDVYEMVQESSARHQQFERRVGLLMWALKTYKHEATAPEVEEWRARLALAQEVLQDEPSEETDLGQGGPGIAAAVCIRDHWGDLTGDEQEWCVQTVAVEVLKHANSWNQFERVQRYEMSPDRSSAYVIASLVAKPMAEQLQPLIREAFVAALTHPITEVRWHAIWGIANQTWESNPELALRCVDALRIEAGRYRRLRTVEEQLPYEERRGYDVLTAEAALYVRQLFWEGDLSQEESLDDDNAEWLRAQSTTQQLAILGQNPDHPRAVTGYTRLARVLVEVWIAGHRYETRRERNYEEESSKADLLQRFVMKASPENAEVVMTTLLQSVETDPRELNTFILGVIGVEDRTRNTAHFWRIWKMFAGRVHQAKWLDTLDHEHATGKELIYALFLGTQWKEGVRHWESVEGHFHLIQELFESLPASAIVLDAYVRCLYHVGERSLPAAFIGIAKKLRLATSQTLLRKSNTIAMLEVLMRRQIYAKPLELKRNPDMREAVISLLDALIDAGSSAAFRMRDDFVTPLSSS